jgi:hypothetical protein
MLYGIGFVRLNGHLLADRDIVQKIALAELPFSETASLARR